MYIILIWSYNFDSLLLLKCINQFKNNWLHSDNSVIMLWRQCGNRPQVGSHHCIFGVLQLSVFYTLQYITIVWSHFAKFKVKTQPYVPAGLRFDVTYMIYCYYSIYRRPTRKYVTVLSFKINFTSYFNNIRCQFSLCIL